MELLGLEMPEPALELEIIVDRLYLLVTLTVIVYFSPCSLS
jgi:hypothetical protein